MLRWCNFVCLILQTSVCQQIKVYTDHKNRTYKSFNAERVMRWQLILEEFSPKLIYIKGSKSIIADTLSRLGNIDVLNKNNINNNNNNNTILIITVHQLKIV